jgi:hypothetical protein
MSLYHPPLKRASLHFKIEANYRSSLELLKSAWRTMATQDGADPESIDLTYVCERLMVAGLRGAWAEVLQLDGPLAESELPTTATNLARFEAALEARAKSKTVRPGGLDANG